MSGGGPCLCGDPACGNCFPGSAARYRAIDAHLSQHESTADPDDDTALEAEMDACARCNPPEPDWDARRELRDEMRAERGDD